MSRRVLRRKGGQRRGGRGGGAGLAFFPTQIAGAIAGWNFDLANVTKDGSDRVSQANDISGGTAHLLNAGAGQPLWVASGLNGRPVLRFASASSEFMLATHAGDKALPNTIYAICKVTNTAAVKPIVDSDTAAKRALLQFDNTEVPVMFAGTSLVGSGGTTNWCSVCADFNGLTSNLYKDNFTTPNASGTAGTNVLGPGFSLGRNQPDTNYLDGDIAEVWVFAGTHTQAQRNLMRDYFNSKFGLSIA